MLMSNRHLSLALACAIGASAFAQKAEILDPAKNAPPGHTGGYLLAAGGSDDCSNAAATNTVVGTGTFPVSTVGATTGAAPAQPQTPSTIKNDVWFYWVAPASGVATLQTCGGSTTDTKIAAWLANNGTACPSGTNLAYNDDACGLQSLINFSVTSGTGYFLQLGHYTEGSTYTGTFTLGVAAPPANDDCTTPTVLTGNGPHAYNTTLASTGTQGQTEAICLFFNQTAVNKDLWFTWTATTSGAVTISTCGQFTSTTTDTKMAVYDGAGCPAAGALVCNDDNAACATQGLSSEVTFTAVCGNTYTIQLGCYGLAANIVGTFTITESGGPCVAGTAYCFGDGTAAVACPCGNAGAAGNGCASSINANGANLNGAGNASISADSLVLTGSGMPNSNALYFQGTTQIAAAFGDGLRCAGGTIIRLGTKLNAAGVSSYPAAGDLSVSVRGNVVAPGVRNYQAWYRNAAAFCTPSTFNLTNGYSVTWTP